jgi:hypothetical protein
MSDDLHELEQRMEQATAPRLQAGSDLEPEIASLRSGWLALEELLVAAEPQIKPPVRSVPVVPAPPRKRRMLLRLVALAASLLVVVSVISYIARHKPTDVDLAKKESIAPPMKQEPAVAENRITPSPSPMKKATAAANKSELAWDDTFDQELSSADFAVRQAQMDKFAFASKSSQIQYQIEGLRDEIEGNNL